MSLELSGVWTALVTPFDEKGRFDEEAFARLIEGQVKAGLRGVVPCGTTGESPTLSPEEHGRVIQAAVKAAGGRLLVMAGTGSNATSEAVEYTRHAAEAGADAALLVAPYYNRPGPEGLIRHFHSVAEQVDLPQVIYNIPGRTGLNIEPRVLKRIAEHPRVIGVKEASGNLDQMGQICAEAKSGFVLLSGDDALTLPAMSVGGRGVISVASNVVPEAVQTLVASALGGDFAGALNWNKRLMPLFKALFLETNPVPVKAALGMLRVCRPDLRLPLTGAGEATREALRRALQPFHAL